MKIKYLRGLNEATTRRALRGFSDDIMPIPTLNRVHGDAQTRGRP